jgi:DNA-binding XRE family transcriptional regulator
MSAMGHRRADVAVRDTFHADVARNVRELRNVAGLSQRELGERVGIAGTHIGLIEQGTTLCSLYVAARIAEALDVTIEDIARVKVIA